MSSTAPSHPPLPQATFDLLIALLCDVVVVEGFRLRLSNALIMAIWQRVTRLAKRFAWLAANGPASLRARPKRPRPPRQPASGPHPEQPPHPKKLPHRPGWLRRLLPSDQLAGPRIVLEYLLAQPYFVDQVEANPTLCQVLRPLCHMLGIKLPTILKIVPPTPAFPPTPPEPSASAAEPPPTPHPPIWNDTPPTPTGITAHGQSHKFSTC